MASTINNLERQVDLQLYYNDFSDIDMGDLGHISIIATIIRIYMKPTLD